MSVPSSVDWNAQSPLQRLPPERRHIIFQHVLIRDSNINIKKVLCAFSRERERRVTVKII